MPLILNPAVFSACNNLLVTVSVDGLKWASILVAFPSLCWCFFTEGFGCRCSSLHFAAELLEFGRLGSGKCFQVSLSSILLRSGRMRPWHGQWKGAIWPFWSCWWHLDFRGIRLSSRNPSGSTSRWWRSSIVTVLLLACVDHVGINGRKLKKKTMFPQTTLNWWFRTLGMELKPPIEIGYLQNKTRRLCFLGKHSDSQVSLLRKWGNWWIDVCFFLPSNRP